MQSGCIYAGQAPEVYRLRKYIEANERLLPDEILKINGSTEPAVLAEELSARRVVIATELGGGVVPVDPLERRKREAAGRLACELARRADTVIRVCCGLPELLKGEWP